MVVTPAGTSPFQESHMQLTFQCVMQDDCERVISALAGPFLNN